jgi:hypothetical protein
VKKKRIVIALVVLGAALIAAQALFPPQDGMAAMVTQRGPHEYVDLEPSSAGYNGNLDYVSPIATLKGDGRDEELQIFSRLSDPITGKPAGTYTEVYTRASDWIANRSVPLSEVKWVKLLNASGTIMVIGVQREKLSRWAYFRETFFHWS